MHSAIASRGTSTTARTTEAQLEWHSVPKCGSLVIDTDWKRQVQLRRVSVLVEPLMA